MGPFKDFDACVAKYVADGKDESSAQRICGAIKRDIEAAQQGPVCHDAEKRDCKRKLPEPEYDEVQQAVADNQKHTISLAREFDESKVNRDGGKFAKKPGSGKKASPKKVAASGTVENLGVEKKLFAATKTHATKVMKGKAFTGVKVNVVVAKSFAEYAKTRDFTPKEKKLLKLHDKNEVPTIYNSKDKEVVFVPKDWMDDWDYETKLTHEMGHAWDFQNNAVSESAEFDAALKKDLANLTKGLGPGIKSAVKSDLKGSTGRNELLAKIVENSIGGGFQEIGGSIPAEQFDNVRALLTERMEVSLKGFNED